MNLALIAAGGLLGVAAVPHCAVMCSAPCTAVIGRDTGARSASWGFHAGRALSYSAAGAISAAGVGALASFGRETALLRPLWALLHAAALAFGLWLLLRGRVPALISPVGRVPPRSGGAQSVHVIGVFGAKPIVRSGLLGVLWVGWPCGVLQAAWVVAGLAANPLIGATTMLAFAATSSAGLAVGPWAWRRFGSDRIRPWAARTAGALLAAASAWALVVSMIPSAGAWCAT